MTSRIVLSGTQRQLLVAMAKADAPIGRISGLTGYRFPDGALAAPEATVRSLIDRGLIRSAGGTAGTLRTPHRITDLGRALVA